jgi:hypothetical protein
VSDARSPDDVREYLTTLWSDLDGASALAPIEAPGEWWCFGVLQTLGIVPTATATGRPQDRLAEVPHDDALRRLLAAIPR